MENNFEDLNENDCITCCVPTAPPTPFPPPLILLARESESTEILLKSPGTNSSIKLSQ